jgi:thiamine-monophosphate kinase
MLVGRYRVPQPRTALARAVRDHAHAAMDVSDGLAGDLAKLCEASGVSAVIEAANIPLSAVATALLARGAVGVEAIVSGGDDYEILCAIPPASFEAFKQAAQTAAVAVAVIGKIVPGSASPSFLNRQGEAIALPRLSYSHF